MGLHRVGHDWSDLAAAACTTWQFVKMPYFVRSTLTTDSVGWPLEVIPLSLVCCPLQQWWLKKPDPWLGGPLATGYGLWPDSSQCKFYRKCLSLVLYLVREGWIPKYLGLLTLWFLNGLCLPEGPLGWEWSLALSLKDSRFRVLCGHQEGKSIGERMRKGMESHGNWRRPALST